MTVHPDAHTGDHGVVTATAGAAATNNASFSVTSEALTTAAGVDYVLTLTNSLITADSVVLATAANGTNTTEGLSVHRVQPAAGSVTIRVTNRHATVALNGTIVINGLVI